MGTSENFAARLAQANLITKTDFDNKLICQLKKINSNKTKHLLVENKFKKLQKFDSIYFKGKSHYEEYGAQNYLGFQPMYRYFTKVVGFVVVVTILIFGNLKCFKERESFQSVMNLVENA